MKYFAGRIFTTTAVQAQHKNKNNAFSWAKNTARGVRFLLGFNMYLFLAQCEQVYLFLAHTVNTQYFEVPGTLSHRYHGYQYNSDTRTDYVVATRTVFFYFIKS